MRQDRRPHSEQIQIPLGGTLAGVSLAQRWYACDQVMPPHAHASGAISFMLGGMVEERSPSAGNRPWQACFGAAVVKPAGVVHSNRFGPRGAHMVSIEIGPGVDVASPAWEMARWLLCEPRSYGWRAQHLICLCGLRLLGAMSGPAGDLERSVAGVMDELGARLRPARARSAPPWMSVALRQLHRPGSLRVRDLGRFLGVHPVTIARAFRRLHGCGVVEYRRTLQVLRAAQRLVETRELPCAVAVACGFADQAHLCRMFRRYAGMSPGQFRARCAPRLN